MTGKVNKLGKFELTAYPDVPDFRDWEYRPHLYPLKSFLTKPRSLAILDQKSEGACTGFGLAAVINMLLRQNDRKEQVSPRMLYEMARRYDEWRGEDYEGSSCRGAIKGWYHMGVCGDKDWPYKLNDQSWLTIERAKNARCTTIGAYYRLGTRISDYHAALNEVGAIYCSATVHAGWGNRKISKSSWKIPYPEQKEGAHAFAIVGYNKEGFWVQNSWGRTWGNKGTALWTYEDWQENIMDAWVLQLGLPTPQIWHLPTSLSNSSAAQACEQKTQTSIARGNIAGHFVHIDDGQFHDQGMYWSNVHDVQETAKLVAASDKYDHLLFYAHGGLNNVKDSAKRVAAMKEVFKDNRIYPYHFMYDTGLNEEIKDLLFGKDQYAKERAGSALDWTDKLIEKVTKTPGRAIWREIKSSAQLPFVNQRAGTQIVQTFLNALWDAGNEQLKIHLAGHSTGGILLAYFLEVLEQIAPTQRIATCSLMAPACSNDLYASHYYPHLTAPKFECGLDEMTVYNLNAKFELDDHVAGIYRKSLLYLVSRAFEERAEMPILGMQVFNQDKKKFDLQNLSFEYSEGNIAGKRSTKSEAHGGFDNDPATLNHILKRILKKNPMRPFQKSDLS